MFEQAAIAVQDQQGFAQLHALIDAAFDARDVEVLLESRPAFQASDSRLRGGAASAAFWARTRSGSTKRCRFPIRA